jgi:hypothetical protein
MPTPSPQPFMTPQTSPCKRPRNAYASASLPTSTIQSPATPVHGFTNPFQSIGADDYNALGATLYPEVDTASSIESNVSEFARTELGASGPNINVATRELVAGERRLKARRDRQKRNLAKLPTNKAHAQNPVCRLPLGAKGIYIYTFNLVLYQLIFIFYNFI